MSLWITAPVSFILTLLVSVCWVLYFRYSNTRQPARAAWADTGIVLIGLVNIVGYTEDHRLAVPILLATWVGTYIAVKRKSK